MKSHPAFVLSREDEERRRIALSLADGDTWRKTAASCVVHIVESYRLGEIDMQGAMAGMRRVAVGCLPQERVWNLGLTALLALQETPLKKTVGRHGPKWPLWLRNATADLVLHEQENNPGLRRAAYHYSRDEYTHGDSATEIALDKLTSIGWFGERGAPTVGTVDDWVRARLKENAARAKATSTSP